MLQNQLALLETQDPAMERKVPIASEVDGRARPGLACWAAAGVKNL
jgi:hypothetical protein